MKVILESTRAAITGGAFRGTGTFNSTSGTTITLPTAVSSAEKYTVSIVPISSSGFIGEVWVEKATNAFTVYNSGSDTSSQFEYTLIYTP